MTKLYSKIILPVMVCLFLLIASDAVALKIVSQYSPRNKERKKRPRTEFIVLHTTEGPKAGSLKKVWQRGEAHYLVDGNGRVYRIIHRSRIAYHAGRSMWNGCRNLDESSIGVEIVGYHNRDLKSAQYTALKELIAELQRIYKIPDKKVLTHSMVAYGTPNRWHKKSHRGRKRCGMNLATYSARRKLGLEDWPRYDPDVKAGRLVVADPLLERALYGSVNEQKYAASSFSGHDANVIKKGRTAWDIARDRYKSSGTVYVLPDGKKVKGSQVTNWKSMPAGTKVKLSEEYQDNVSEKIKMSSSSRSSGRDIAGDEYNSKTTLYFLKKGKVVAGNKLSGKTLNNLPQGTKILVGYVIGGSISARKSAFDVCGARWDDPSTVYYFPDGSFKYGTTINEKTIPKKTQVFFQK